MKVLVIDQQYGRTEIAVSDKDAIITAHILEASTIVKTFYVDGLNCTDQQKVYGVGGFLKWISPIQQ